MFIELLTQPFKWQPNATPGGISPSVVTQTACESSKV